MSIKTYAIYPVYPDSFQRNILLNALGCYLDDLDARKVAPEVALLREKALEVLQMVQEAREEDHGFFQAMLGFNERNERTKDINYCVMQVSKDRFVICKRVSTASTNYTGRPEFGPYDPKVYTPNVGVKMVTRKLKYRELDEIYPYLAMGKKLPEKYQEYMLGNED